ncbi:uncharacterized protein B0H18DRAFT_1121906 [Fomitopsis serialis]|uniref:uncharacterized protein n=1 Tax=Fomitopsis serialis TaxID=139415 RepID=UPI002008518D|nr:uncharacterized protein B0H18DRAFT_1121906 [Neoantrodia serialis]KAH9920439.1 hypothetical protein B0H18DRAFT_1121906 [Neoantrodia serialis]
MSTQLRYVLWAPDCTDADVSKRRISLAEAHVTWLDGQVSAGVIHLNGAILAADEAPPANTMPDSRGSLMIIKAGNSPRPRPSSSRARTSPGTSYWDKAKLTPSLFDDFDFLLHAFLRPATLNMRYPAVISAVLIAVTAAPALAAPSGLDLRAVKDDALAQRSFDDVLYARDLLARGNADPSRPQRSRSPTPTRTPLHPKPGPRKPRPGPPYGGPQHGPPPSAPKPIRVRSLDEYLLARASEEDELFARAWEDAVFARTLS